MKLKKKLLPCLLAAVMALALLPVQSTLAVPVFNSITPHVALSGVPQTFAVDLYDTDGDIIMVHRIASAPQHGTATLVDGSYDFTYTSNDGYTGEDSVALHIENIKEEFTQATHHFYVFDSLPTADQIDDGFGLTPYTKDYAFSGSTGRVPLPHRPAAGAYPRPQCAFYRHRRRYD